MSDTRMQTTRTDIPKIAVVAVFYEKEGEMAGLLARSLRLYLDPDMVSRIVFLNNAAVADQGREIFRTLIAPELGQLLPYTQCLDAADLGVPPEDGYTAQQALKMEIARHLEEPFYLVLDAKNHLVKPLEAAHLFAPDGRPRSYYSPYSGYLLTCLQHSCAYFDVEESGDHQAYPTVTPSLLVTQIVRDMLDAIGRREGLNIYETIRQNDKRTEFLLYSAWLMRNQGIDTVYAMGAKHFSTLFARWPQAPQDVGRVIRAVDTAAIYAFGVHARRFAQLDAAQSVQLAGMWVEAGLFGDEAAALAFIAAQAARFPLPPEPTAIEKARAVDVLTGRSGRLFILNGSNAVLDQHRGVRLLSPGEVTRWSRLIETRTASARERGAEFAMLIAPDSHAIFREDIAELDGVTLDRPILQVLHAMGCNPRFHYPLAALRAGRAHGQVCHMTDSHWSGFGAWLAWRAFLAGLPFKLHGVGPDEVEIFEAEGPGDLGDKLDPPLRGAFTECVVRKPQARLLWNNGVGNRGYMAYWRNQRQDLPRGLLFMDSYGWKLQRFMAEAFSELFLVHSPFYEWEAVETYAPDVIISEMAERFMNRPPDDQTTQPALVSAQAKKPDVRYPSLAELRALP